MLVIFHFKMNCSNLQNLKELMVRGRKMDLLETQFQKDLVNIQNSMYEEGLGGIEYVVEGFAKD